MLFQAIQRGGDDILRKVTSKWFGYSQGAALSGRPFLALHARIVGAEEIARLANSTGQPLLTSGAFIASPAIAPLALLTPGPGMVRTPVQAVP